jgi:hypothetical protein
MKALAVVVLVACGPKSTHTTTTAVPPAPGDKLLALLPDGAQLVVEVDLARLRSNAVVGSVVKRALDEAATSGSALPAGVPASPLAGADRVVMAAYAVGTPHAATVTLLATRGEVAGARRLAADVVALGPAEWVDQIQTRAAIAGVSPTADAAPHLQPSPELLALRDRSMPPGAPGASLRITARLPFDARVALARQTGIEEAPAQMSIWGDVVDDMAIIVDVDPADPGEKNPKRAAARMTAIMQHTLAALGNLPEVRALGVIDSLENARIVSRGTWVRAIIAIGPEHLKRAMVRANERLGKP